jgi:hypothetical protein
MPDRPTESRPEGLPHPSERLASAQREFAAHIRDPARHPAPADVENRRMAIYRRLFFNNINSLLSGNFPVLRSLYAEQPWLQLVRDFYADHRCRTPLFPEIAKEFLRYLQERQPAPVDPPFILELAHYEWVELALSLDEREIGDVPADADGDLLNGRPVLSPLAWALSYRYPVHRIQPDFQPSEPPDEATHLLVYRDRDDSVRFMRLNDVTRLLLQQLRDSPGLSGRAHLRRVAERIRHPDPQRVIEAGSAVMEDLRERDVLLGSSPGAAAS